MSSVILAIFIASVPSVITGVLSWLQSRKNTGKIDQVHILFNSRMDDLLKAHGEAQHAAGMQQERQENRDRAEVKIDKAEARADKLAAEVPKPSVTLATPLEQTQANQLGGS
jgi:hypothetical protein